MNKQSLSPADVRLAKAVRAACVRAALEAFEDASIQGLCCTGAWECAVGAVRALDLEAVIRAQQSRTGKQA
ncbi:MAG: acetyltransferase [Rhodothermales bacterium]